jgi:hypothetical protein
LAERDTNIALTDQIASTATINQHSVGIVGIKAISSSTAPYVDLPINLFSLSQRDSQPSSGAATSLTKAVFFGLAEISSGLESGVIEQTQPGAVAVSTAKLIDIATQSNTVFDINNLNIPPPATPDDCGYYVSNFQSTVHATYQIGDWQRIESLILYSGSCPPTDGGQRVIAPSLGNYTVGFGRASVIIRQARLVIRLVP